MTRFPLQQAGRTTTTQGNEAQAQSRRQDIWPPGPETAPPPPVVEEALTPRDTEIGGGGDGR